MKALLFDFGGTLDTDGVHWSEQFREAFARVLPPVTDAVWRACFVRAEASVPSLILPDDDFLQTLQKQVASLLSALDASRAVSPALAPGTADEIARFCIARVRAQVRRHRPVLQDLHAHHKLAVVSNFYGNLQSVCADLRLLDLIDVLVDSTRVGIRKPDPAIFREALEQLRVRPADAIVVGDSYRNDVTPGKALGCVTVWLRRKPWEEVPAPTLADHIVESLSALPDLMARCG